MKTQEIMAHLITNMSLFSTKESLESFYLSKNIAQPEQETINQFLAQNQHIFNISAKLLLKRRKDDIKDNLPLLSRIISEESFEKYWLKYQEKVNPSQVSKNPLLEAKYFCDSTLAQKGLSTLIREILRYESVKLDLIYKSLNNSSIDNTDLLYHIFETSEELYQFIQHKQTQNNKKVTLFIYHNLKTNHLTTLKLNPLDIKKIILSINNLKKTKEEILFLSQHGLIRRSRD